MEQLFTAHIEKDEDSGYYVGTISNVPGAYTQASTLDELSVRLKEVLELCFETMTDVRRKKIFLNLSAPRKLQHSDIVPQNTCLPAIQYFFNATSIINCFSKFNKKSPVGIPGFKIFHKSFTPARSQNSPTP